ncbi:protein of unknown function [Cognatiyoonia sediminum]|uniref:YjiS-like domain-containing protein n=1 Tax=Cognatiyoonia sediminum TaxID=1508389 RepID=A0A1M5L8F8_9RHOB|nr:DUF1127 domain-containing protein [Cognatiyoonia sediminum]SHG61298.1 protein of unknown function [Cognatiyoonia sediminum]
MAYVSTTRATSVTFGQRFNEFRARMAEASAQRKTYNTTMSELSALSNRELADLGLHRSMIKQVALEAAYGK